MEGDRGRGGGREIKERQGRDRKEKGRCFHYICSGSHSEPHGYMYIILWLKLWHC